MTAPTVTRFDPERRLLHGPAGHARLPPQAATALNRMALQPSYPVHLQVLVRAVYPDAARRPAKPEIIVQGVVARLRDALEATGSGWRIQTERRRGYSLVVME